MFAKDHILYRLKRHEKLDHFWKRYSFKNSFLMMREYGGWNIFRIAGGNLKIRKIISL